ncbi:MAG TPA: GNAT family N-acetyltransferase [Rhodanobacteraceae bacterium]|nr:GNAT family N-acetyltransferase [Rhodanobacteraceae bacterium]
MILKHDIRLATLADAARIGEMSRDLIEHGLGWRWTPNSIRRCIRDPATNVAVAAAEHGGVAGFAVMRYKDDEAHLILLGVDPAFRRRGIASALIAWHEKAALTAGIGTVYVEARATNAEARALYRQLGYHEVQLVRGYYSGVENGVRLAKDLWESPPRS